ncbi:MAG: transposase [Bacteroidaceae bacterium]|nr:transposase [Bacteroidaceae bacterium]
MEYKRKARERLTSEKVLMHRSKRPIEPEAVFGQMKYNMQYKRFRHFGKDKVNMDFAFFAIAFDIKKMAAIARKLEKMHAIAGFFVPYKLIWGLGRTYHAKNTKMAA